MPCRFRFTLVAWLWMAAASAQADEPTLDVAPVDLAQRVITVRVQPQRVPEQGTVTACVLQFVALVPDPDGAVAHATLTGVLRMQYETGGKPLYAMSVGLSAKRDGGKVAVAPVAGYLRGADGKPPGTLPIVGSRSTAETTQFVGNIDADTLNVNRSIIQQRTFTVGWRVRAGAEWTEVPIDVSTIRILTDGEPRVVRGNAGPELYARCMAELSEQMLKR